MGRLPTGVFLLSCLLLLLLQSPCEAVDCLVDTCAGRDSCTVAGKYYCCSAGYMVEAISVNGVLRSCTCQGDGSSYSGSQCTYTSGANPVTSVTSASWLTCALTVTLLFSRFLPF